MDEKKYITVEIDLLRELLSEAFETGWGGFKDLKEDTVEKLIKQCEEKDASVVPNTPECRSGWSLTPHTWASTGVSTDTGWSGWAVEGNVYSNNIYTYGTNSYGTNTYTVTMPPSTTATSIAIEDLLPDDLSEEDAETIKRILENRRT